MKLDAVLLVDDDDTTNFYNEIILKKSGICDKVYVALNGKEALAMLTGEKGEKIAPSLILLDINMPIMNGFEFLENYEKLPESNRADLVVVMLTTSLHPRDLKRADEFTHLAGYINKPLNADQLKELLAEKFD